MQRTLKRLALAALLSAPLFSGTLTVVQPNGGETYVLGETKALRWTATDVSQNVRINLVRGNEVVGTIVSGLPASGGHYLWKVGQLTDGTAPAGGDYFIRVRAIDSTESDQNDGPFSIAVARLPEGRRPVTLKIDSPNGGESWRLGSDQVISWSGKFLAGKVMLQLYHAAGAPAGLIADDQPASGSFSWKAGKLSSGYVADGSYKVRVVAKDNYTVNDMSDAPFDLKPRLAEVAGPVNPKLLGKPDLVVCAESAIYTSYGVHATIHVGVRNIGTRTAKAGFAVRYSVGSGWTDPYVIPVDLPPGGEYSAFGVSPTPYEAGTKVFIFAIDPDQQVDEENEDNNRISTSFTVTDGPLPANGPYRCSNEVEETVISLK